MWSGAQTYGPLSIASTRQVKLVDHFSYYVPTIRNGGHVAARPTRSGSRRSNSPTAPTRRRPRHEGPWGRGSTSATRRSARPRTSATTRPGARCGAGSPTPITDRNRTRSIPFSPCRPRARPGRPRGWRARPRSRSPAGRRRRCAATRSVQAEIMLNAERARWRPGKAGTGTLVLDELDPRMAVMAVAPRRETVVVPASMLAANWKGLFGRTATRRTSCWRSSSRVAASSSPSAPVCSRAPHRELRLAVSPLRQGAHELDALGSSPRATRASPSSSTPRSPTRSRRCGTPSSPSSAARTSSCRLTPRTSTRSHTYFVDGFDPEPRGRRRTPGRRAGTSGRRREGSHSERGPRGRRGLRPVRARRPLGLGNERRRYDGLALFDGAQAVVVDPSRASRGEVTNSAMFGMSLASSTSERGRRRAEPARHRCRSRHDRKQRLRHRRRHRSDARFRNGDEHRQQHRHRGPVGQRGDSLPAQRQQAGHVGRPQPSSGTSTSRASPSETELRGAFIDRTTFQGCGMSGFDFSGAEIAGGGRSRRGVPAELRQLDHRERQVRRGRAEGRLLPRCRLLGGASASTAPSSGTSTSPAPPASSTSTGRT